jgi:hypothetical protein
VIERSVRNADGLTPWLVIDSCSRGAELNADAHAGVGLEEVPRVSWAWPD